MQRRMLSTISAGALLLLGGAQLLAGTPAANAATSVPVTQNCVTKLFPLINYRSTGAPVTHCFETFSEAMRFASNGRLKLPIGVTTVSTELARSSGMIASPSDPATSNPLLSIEYRNEVKGGATHSFIGSSGTGCTGGTTYGFPTMPSGWNDVIESSQGYSNCDVTHYENTYYNQQKNGVEITCKQYCDTLDAMYNATSSIVERPHGTGT